MAASREAKLIMSLVDQVTRPGKAIAKSLGMVNQAVGKFGSGAMAPARAVSRMSQGFRKSATESAAFSAAIGLGAKKAAENVYQYQKVGNAAEAIGMMTEGQRKDLEALGRSLNEKYPFTNREIMEAAVELLRAGYTFDQTKGALADALNTSLAGDLGLGQTADILTNVAQAMRLPIETQEDAAKTTREVSDVLAFAANRSNTDIALMGTTFKYVAPLAAATGMSLKEMASATMLLANNGIKGSDAGTGLRFALARLLSPSEDAQHALARLNIDVGNFVKGARAIKATDVISQLSLAGIDAGDMEKQIQAVLDDPAIKLSPAKLTGRLTNLISEGLGQESLIDKDVLSKNLSETLSVLGTEIDFKGLIRALKDNPESQALIPKIFGIRHGPKMLALMAGDLDGVLADLEAKYSGAADRMSKTRIKGVVGDVTRLAAALDNLTMTLSNTGVLTSAMKALKGMAEGINEIGDLNPKILEFGTYALLSLAAVAPLGFALTGAGAAAALLLNPITGIVAALATLAAINVGPIAQAISTFANSAQAAFSPQITAGVTNAIEALKQFVTFKIDGGQAAALKQLAKDLGEGFAGAVNAAGAALPDLERIAGSIVASR